MLQVFFSDGSLNVSFLFQGERATGYGVALLVTLFGKASSSKLLQSIAPDLPAKDSGLGF